MCTAWAVQCSRVQHCADCERLSTTLPFASRQLHRGGRGGGSASAERGRHARDHAVTPNAAGVRAVRGARDTHVPFEPTSHTCTCIMQNIRELCLRAQSQTNTHTQHSTRGGRARVSATQAAGWGSTEGWGSTGFHGAKICNARHPRFGEASSAALTGRPSATP